MEPVRNLNIRFSCPEDVENFYTSTGICIPKCVKGTVAVFDLGEFTETSRKVTKQTGPSLVAEWEGMPEFHQPKSIPFLWIILSVPPEFDSGIMTELLGQKITDRTKSVWHPYKAHHRVERKVWIHE